MEGDERSSETRQRVSIFRSDLGDLLGGSGGSADSLRLPVSHDLLRAARARSAIGNLNGRTATLVEGSTVHLEGFISGVLPAP